MRDLRAVTSPLIYARIAGWLGLISVLAGIFAGFVRSALVVSADAAATATNILTSELLYRFSLAADIVTLTCSIIMTLVFYELFRPVNRSVSLLAAFFNLVACAVGALSCLFYLAPLVLLAGPQYLSVFNVEQLRALALVSLKLHTLGTNIGIAFFGFHILLVGYLIFRSTFFPRFLGVLVVIGALSLLTASFVSFLSPDLAQRLPLSGLAGMSSGVGPGSLCAWLIMVGANVPKWKERANASRVMEA